MRAQRSLICAKALGRYAKSFPEPATDRLRSKATAFRPFAKVETWVVDKASTQFIWPITALRIGFDEAGAQRITRFLHIAFGETRNEVGIGNRSNRAGAAIQRQVQNQRAIRRENILMGFVTTVKDDIASLNGKPAPITCFKIAAIEHQRRVGIDMSMSR